MSNVRLVVKPKTRARILQMRGPGSGKTENAVIEKLIELWDAVHGVLTPGLDNRNGAPAIDQATDGK